MGSLLHVMHLIIIHCEAGKSFPTKLIQYRLHCYGTGSWVSARVHHTRPIKYHSSHIQRNFQRPPANQNNKEKIAVQCFCTTNKVTITTLTDFCFTISSTFKCTLSRTTTTYMYKISSIQNSFNSTVTCSAIIHRNTSLTSNPTFCYIYI